MMRGARRATVVAVLAWVAGQPVWALSVDEVIRLSNAGVGEPIILSQIQAEGMAAALTSGDLVALKQGGVSDTVIQAMQQSVAPASASRRPEASPVRSAARSANVTVTNESGRDLSVTVSRDSRRIEFGEAGGGDVTIVAGESRGIRLPAGGYEVGWGEAGDFGLAARNGSSTELRVSERRTTGGSALRVDVIEDGDVVDGGTLKRFGETRRSSRREETEYGSVDVDQTPQRLNITINNSASAPATPAYLPPPQPVSMPATVMVPASYVRTERYERRGPPCVSDWPEERYASRDSGSGPVEGILGDHWQDGLPGARTLVGAGLGAIIGNQYHEKGKGAAVGAGVGYLLDQFLGR